MIRNRIKKRIEQRRSNKLAAHNANDTDPNDELDQTNENPIDTSTQASQTKNNTKDSEQATETKADDSDPNEDLTEDFNYLTDVCKEKKFNKKDLSIILKVLKLELQPIIYLLLFTKGILLWTNTFFTFLVFVLLLYFAYINIVKYLFGLCFLVVSLLMFSMKANSDKTIFILAVMVGFVIPIEIDNEIEGNDGNKSDESKEKELKRWQLFQRARKVKQKIQQKFIQLGEFEYLLYLLSIYIGKLRAIYFYKNETFAQPVCIAHIVIGVCCIILPLRINYAMIVIVAFVARPLLAFVKQKRGKDKQGELAKKVKSAFDKVEPDIPNIQFDIKEQ